MYGLLANDGHSFATSAKCNMPVFENNGISFYYERHGSGPVLVFTHGLTGDLTVMLDMLSNLTGYSLLVWDCRAHGRTEPVGPEDAFTFGQLAADLRALLDHCQIESAIVGGVSMGAAVSARFALDFPDMVSHLILVRPAWLDDKSPEPLHPAIKIGDLLEMYDVEEARSRFLQSAEYESVFQADPAAATSYCESFEKPQATERAVRLRRIPRDCPINSWNEVALLKVPTLVIGCEPDYIHPIAYAREWLRHLSQAIFVQVPSKPLHPTQHNEAVADAVRSFLSNTIAH